MSQDQQKELNTFPITENQQEIQNHANSPQAQDQTQALQNTIRTLQQQLEAQQHQNFQQHQIPSNIQTPDNQNQAQDLSNISQADYQNLIQLIRMLSQTPTSQQREPEVEQRSAPQAPPMSTTAPAFQKEQPPQMVPLPRYQMEEFKGKTYVFDFLQYLLKQKQFLLNTNIADQERKQLLNSRLPYQVSNSSTFMVYDNSITFTQFVDWVGKTYGPRLEQIREQLMQQSISRYEHYTLFVNRLQGYCSFANISDEQFIFILDLKLPKHLTSSIKNRSSLQNYIFQIEKIQHKGWFESVDQQYRQTLRYDQKNKQGEKSQQSYNKGDTKQKDKTEVQTGVLQIEKKDSENVQECDTAVKTGVVSIGYRDDIRMFANDGPPASNLRNKRQHVDVRRDQQQPLQQQNQAQTQQQQQQQQQTNQQNPFINQEGQVPPGSSTTHLRDQINQQQQNTNKNGQDQVPNIQNQKANKNDIQKLLEKLLNNLPQDDEGRKRGKKPLQSNVSQENQKKNHFVVADPYHYINENGQVNLTQYLQDQCLAIPVTTFLSLIGYQITQKTDQNIQRNLAYYNNSNISSALQQNNQFLKAISTPVYNTNTVFEEPQSSVQNVYSQDQIVYNQDLQNQQQGTDQVSLEVLTQAFKNLLNTNQNQPQDNIQSPQNTFNTCMQNVDLNQKRHICIPVYINNTLIKGVLDGGAEQTLISLQQVQKANIMDKVTKQPQNQKGVYVTGCTGEERMYGIIESITVTMEDHEVLWENIFVQENTTFDLLIGLDILGLFSVQQCFNTRRATFIPYAYPDNQRVPLTIIEDQSTNNHAHVAFTTIQQRNNTQDVLSYVEQTLNLYPNFPIYKQYQIIYLDPAWQYDSKMFHSHNRPPYPCLSYGQLKLLPIPIITDSNGCIVLIWTTGSHMKQCQQLLIEWGLKYINFFLIWRKISKSGSTYNGVGYYTRSTFEYLVIATKGRTGQFRRKRPNLVSQDLSTYETNEIAEPRNKYFSRKPSIVYDKISQIFEIEKLNCIEIFATQRIPQNYNYDLYGNTLTPNFQKQILYETLKLEPQVKTYFNKSIYSQTIQEQDPFSNFINNLVIGKNITQQTLQSLKNLIGKYKSIFKFTNELSYTNLGVVDVKIKPFSKPIRMKPYKVIGEAFVFLKNKFNELEKYGLVSKGSSEWGTAVMCVPKDSPLEKFRAVQNFKRVNQITEKDKYPLRHIDVIIMSLRNKKFLCVLDMKGGFNQIRRADESKHIMAMVLPFGQYIPNVMFFGETNAPSIFQRFVDEAISDMYGRGVECYIDDIVVYANTEEEMLALLQELFQKLQQANFKLAPEKCSFFINKANVLGHEVNGADISPKQKKVDKILKLEPPKTQKQLQQFMGSINYYRKFIPNLSTLFISLQNSLSSKQFLWNQEQQNSFDIIISFLKEKLILKIPDLSKQFIVLIYYSNLTYASAILQQEAQGEFVVAFQSKVCSVSQQKMQPYIREIDCLTWALNEFRHLLQHQSFKVRANYEALKYLYECKTNNLQILNYQLQLQDLIFEVEPISGSRLKAILLQTFLKNDPLKLKHLESLMEEIPSTQNLLKGKDKEINQGSNFKNYEFILQFDGASQTIEFKTQVGSGAFVLFDNNKVELFKDTFIFPGAQTNNCAEYSALINGLKYLLNNNYQKRNILIQGDSQLVINQITYKYMCNSENLSQLCNEARALLKRFSKIHVEHIDRSFNKTCDKLAKEALKKQISKLRNQSYVYATNISKEIHEIYCQICSHTQPENTMLLCDHCNNGWHTECVGLSHIPQGFWYCPECQKDITYCAGRAYVDPIEDVQLLSILQGQLTLQELSPNDRNRVEKRLPKYTIINDKLFKQGSNQLKEVPSIAERISLTQQVHQLIGHLGMNRTISLIKCTFYWPNMNQQIEDILRGCLLCQAQNPQYLSMPGAYPLDKIFKPMQVLYIDSIYLPMTNTGNRMAVIAICGTSKWVEASPTKTNNSQETANFLFDQIICRYGCPQIIHSDRGPEFKGDFKAMCERLGIIHFYSNPEYPQSHGQVERVNRTIKNGLIKLVNSFTDYNYQWDELLQQILMGLRFTVARPIKYSPYQLLFGTDPVVPGFQGIFKELTLCFPNDVLQDNFISEKVLLKQQLLDQVHSNLRSMEEEIQNVIQAREKISPSNLEFGNLVFLKRKDALYPQTKSQGPYLFLKYADQNRTTVLLVNLRNSKITQANITKVSPIKQY